MAKDDSDIFDELEQLIPEIDPNFWRVAVLAGSAWFLWQAYKLDFNFSLNNLEYNTEIKVDSIATFHYSENFFKENKADTLQQHSKIYKSDSLSYPNP